MRLCEFCNKPIPKKRDNRLINGDFKKNSGRPVKYCSERCNKNAWLYRHNRMKTTSFKKNNREEWEKTDTGKGYLWEDFVCKLIGAKRANGENFSLGYDLLWKTKRIDVKSCNPSFNNWWSFMAGKKREADLYCCIGLIKGIPSKVFMIPASVLGGGISISFKKSKYDKYLLFPLEV